MRDAYASKRRKKTTRGDARAREDQGGRLTLLPKKSGAVTPAVTAPKSRAQSLWGSGSAARIEWGGQSMARSE